MFPPLEGFHESVTFWLVTGVVLLGGDCFVKAAGSVVVGK